MFTFILYSVPPADNICVVSTVFVKRLRMIIRVYICICCGACGRDNMYLYNWFKKSIKQSSCVHLDLCWRQRQEKYESFMYFRRKYITSIICVYNWTCSGACDRKHMYLYVRLKVHKTYDVCVYLDLFAARSGVYIHWKCATEARNDFKNRLSGALARRKVQYRVQLP